jgi:hypothetical protein
MRVVRSSCQNLIDWRRAENRTVCLDQQSIELLLLGVNASVISAFLPSHDRRWLVLGRAWAVERAWRGPRWSRSAVMGHIAARRPGPGMPGGGNAPRSQSRTPDRGQRGRLPSVIEHIAAKTPGRGMPAGENPLAPKISHLYPLSRRRLQSQVLHLGSVR